MSEATQIPEDPVEQSPERPVGRPGLLADPLVRVMIYASMGLIILFLATIIGVMVTGVTAPTGPRSVAERAVMTAAAQVGGTTGDASAPYVNALIAAGNLPAARVALAQARSGVPASKPTPDLDLAEARLLSAGEKYAEAVSLAERAMKGFTVERDALNAKESTDTETPKTYGFSVDYYNSALVKGYALAKLGRWKDAVTAYDIYILENPTASDILIDRGNAKAELNDKAGAEQDFRAALRFVPYDPEAKAGLKKIGVAQ